MGYVISTEFHAYHHSGNRPLSQILWFVIHDIETDNMVTGAEGAAAWLSRAASGGSAHYCIDNQGPIYRLLSLSVIAWGAPGANEAGVHYELAGRAAWTRAQWLGRAKPTLNRTAWLLARNHHYLLDHGICVPLVKLTDAQMKAHRRGIVTHRQVTRVTGIGSHWDPGYGFPMDYLVEKARSFA